jgi:hypothetical protein
VKVKHFLLVALLLLLTAALLVAFKSSAPVQATATPGTPTAAATKAASTPTVAATKAGTTPTPAPKEAAGAESQPPCPALFQEAWASSAHARADAAAFTHWNEADPAEIPVECARCHSTPGYLDFLGDDGTQVGSVENPAPTGTVITCAACHSPSAIGMTSVVFPSGAEITDIGRSARCMVCHQGRSSTVQVNEALTKAGLDQALDKVDPTLSFLNIHYFAAAATLYGSQAMGGYQFEGKAYQPKNTHVAGMEFCSDCHSPHTLQVQVEKCATCHDGVKTSDDLRNIRMQGSLVDFDGDGNIKEGISYEIQGLQEMLLKTIQAYASEVAKTPIAYTPDVHPYFFIDKNKNGKVDEAETDSANKYNAFTGRLLQAAYNYQLSIKDPGAFAHNAKYVIELLYDSIASLNEKLAKPIDLSLAYRDDPGHFRGIAEAFRHWDEEGEVSATCAKCHSAGGLPLFLKDGVTISVPPSESLKCTTCHTEMQDFTLRDVAEVTFPSGAKIGFGEGQPSNLCLVCHQGRQSTVSVNAAIEAAGVGPDEVSDKLSFRNPHYFAAGATLFGTEAKGAYEYEGKEYNGRFPHVAPFDTCAECHNAHSGTINVQGCSGCHKDVKTVADLEDCRLGIPEPDYDGDGKADEGICGEIRGMQDALLTAIQAYATKTIKTDVVYSPTANPYWFSDTNKNGKADEDEINSDNRYATWTPTLLRAAYNYQFITKDPGAFAHNGRYVAQILYDSIEAIGGKQAVAKMTRPPVAQ